VTRVLLQREADRLQERIDCLTRNRDASHAYLAAVASASIPVPGSGRERRSHRFRLTTRDATCRASS